MDNANNPANSQSANSPPRRPYLQHKLPPSFTARNRPHPPQYSSAQEHPYYYSQEQPYYAQQEQIPYPQHQYQQSHQQYQYHHHHQYDQQPAYDNELEQPYVAPPGYPLSADLLPKSASNPMTPAEIDAKRREYELQDAQKGILRPLRSRKCEELLAQRLRTVAISSDGTGNSNDSNNTNNRWTVTPEQLFENRNRDQAQRAGGVFRRARSSMPSTAAATRNVPTSTAHSHASATTKQPQDTSGNGPLRRASTAAGTSTSPSHSQPVSGGKTTCAETQKPQAAEGGSGPFRRNATSIPTSPTPKLDVASGPLRRAATASVTSPSPPMYETYQAVGKPRVGISPLSSTFQRRMILSDYSAKPHRFKALLVGISYKGVPGKTELPGIRNDLREVYLLLVAKLGFLPENIRILSDLQINCGEINAIEKPTLGNILGGMKWISQEAKPGDSLFFFFAGHGDIVTDFSGDEIDSNYDQCLVPCDSRPAAANVSRNVNVNSNINGNVNSNSYINTNVIGGGEDRDMPPSYLHDPTQKAGESVLFSGAADLQRSAEVRERNTHRSFGVMTRAFVDIILEIVEQNKRGYFPTFSQVLIGIEKQIHIILQKQGMHNVQQDPQISSSHLFNLYTTPFSF